MRGSRYRKLDGRGTGQNRNEVECDRKAVEAAEQGIGPRVGVSAPELHRHVLPAPRWFVKHLEVATDALDVGVEGAAGFETGCEDEQRNQFAQRKGHGGRGGDGRQCPGDNRSEHDDQSDCSSLADRRSERSVFCLTSDFCRHGHRISRLSARAILSFPIRNIGRVGSAASELDPMRVALARTFAPTVANGARTPGAAPGSSRLDDVLAPALNCRKKPAKKRPTDRNVGQNRGDHYGTGCNWLQVMVFTAKLVTVPRSVPNGCPQPAAVAVPEGSCH